MMRINDSKLASRGSGGCGCRCWITTRRTGSDSERCCSPLSKCKVLTLNFSGCQFLVSADAGSFGELSYAKIFLWWSFDRVVGFFKLADFFWSEPTSLFFSLTLEFNLPDLCLKKRLCVIRVPSWRAKSALGSWKTFAYLQINLDSMRLQKPHLVERGNRASS